MFEGILVPQEKVEVLHTTDLSAELAHRLTFDGIILD